MFAANYLGAIAMPINWRLAAPEVRYILEHSEARALVCDEPLVGAGGRGHRRAGGRAGAGPASRAAGRRGLDAAGRAPEAARAAPAPVRAEPDDVHRLMYTSGTTGRPKGVMITHANLAWKNLAHLVEFGFTAADLGLACGPLYHVGALDLTTTSLIAAGATHHHPPGVRRRRGGRRAGAVAGDDGLAGARRWSTPSWRCPTSSNATCRRCALIINGGEKMPIPLIERIQRTFPSAWFADAYGLTETVSGDTFLDRDSIVTKLGSVGRPCLHLELEVWDEQGRPVARRRAGRDRDARAQGVQGVLARPRGDRRAFAGGWFHTGDIGVRDDDGYLFIVDRLKDMIVSGGENIAGSEVERVLYEHAAVLEAAVVGRPDERWGEVPVAFVVLRPGHTATADELIGALPGAAGPLQGPEGGHLPGGAAAQPVGQGAQARPARAALTTS